MAEAITPEEKEKRERPEWKSRAIEAEEKIAQVSYQLKSEQAQAKTLTERLSQISVENETLKRENAELRGRVSELERLVDRQLAAA